MTRFRAPVMRALTAFNTWFSSASGVVQTAILVLLVAIVDAAGLDHDRSGYWLLWALTVYSAITQPALAYSATIASAQNAELLQQNSELLRRVASLEEHNARLIERLDAGT